MIVLLITVPSKPSLFKRVFLPVLFLFVLTAFMLRLAYDKEFFGLLDARFWGQLWRVGQVMELAHQNYLYTNKVTYNNLADAALDHMLDGLDRYSEYFPKQDYTNYKNESDQVIVGIGVELERRNGHIEIVRVVPNSPAAQAGWRQWDRIDAIGDVNAGNLSVQDISNLLRGPVGTSVRVTHERPSDIPDRPGVIHEETLIRGGFAVPSLTNAETLPDNVRYMRITQFGKNTGQEFSDDLRGRDMRGLIIDLRDNPGGLLAVTTDFLEPLLPANTLVVSTRGRNGIPDEVLKTTGNGDVHYTGPVVVLVNENTASAAEIVAGALQDNHRAVILGTRTFGKGIVQTLYDLQDGTGVKLTTQAYYLPGNSPAGRSIQDVGITPDVILPQSEDNREILRLQRGDLRFLEAEKTIGLYRQAPADTLFAGLYGFAPIPDAQIDAADALIRAVTPDVK